MQRNGFRIRPITENRKAVGGGRTNRGPISELLLGSGPSSGWASRKNQQLLLQNYRWSETLKGRVVPQTKRRPYSGHACFTLAKPRHYETRNHATQEV